MSPKVSVIIPTFNRGKTLKRAIDSVLKQTFKEIELIVIDDGSQDGTSEIVAQYKNITYLKQTNQGVSFSRNIGIKKSAGEYIAFLDSDDEWLPEKLETQLKFLGENSEYVWVHTEEIWVRNGVRVNPMKKHKKGGGDQFLPSLELCLISPSSVMIKRELLEKEKFDETLEVCEDFDLWLRLLLGHQIGFIPTPQIIKYGGHDDQLSRKHFGMDVFRVRSLNKLLQYYPLSQSQRSNVEKVMRKKMNILRKGAIKHNNQVMLEELQSISNLSTSW